MKIILLQDEKKLGKKGDIINASDGYARNYILPKKLGVEATAANANDLKLQKANQEKIAAKQLADAKELAEKLEKIKVNMKIKTGEGGKTFGSVSAKEISEAAKTSYGLDIDRKKIVLATPVKTTGEFSVPVKLHPKVTGNLKVRVEAE